MKSTFSFELGGVDDEDDEDDEDDDDDDANRRAAEAASVLIGRRRCMFWKSTKDICQGPFLNIYEELSY